MAPYFPGGWFGRYRHVQCTCLPFGFLKTSLKLDSGVAAGEPLTPEPRSFHQFNLLRSSRHQRDYWTPVEKGGRRAESCVGPLTLWYCHVARRRKSLLSCRSPFSRGCRRTPLNAARALSFARQRQIRRGETNQEPAFVQVSFEKFAGDGSSWAVWFHCMMVPCGVFLN